MFVLFFWAVYLLWMDPSVCISQYRTNSFTLILEAAWENLHTYEMWRRIIRCTLEPKILISVMWIIYDWLYTAKMVPYKVLVYTYYDHKREIKKKNTLFNISKATQRTPIGQFQFLFHYSDLSMKLSFVKTSPQIESSCQPENPAVLCCWVMPPKRHYGNCIWLNLMTSYPTTAVQISSG